MDPTFELSSALDRMRAMPAHLNLLSLNRAEVQSILSHFDQLILPVIGDDPEQHRREPPSIDGTPLRDASVMDYGAAGNLIDRAVHHLDEGLPLGQRLRCRYAYKMLTSGVLALGTWMTAKGYFSDPPVV